MNRELETSLVAKTMDLWNNQTSPPNLETLANLLEGSTVREQAKAILVDQRMRFEQKSAIAAEQYFKRFSNLAKNRDLQLDIVCGEVHSAHSNGVSIELEDMIKRFPNLKSDLTLHLEVYSLFTGIDEKENDALELDVTNVHKTADSTSEEEYDPAPLLFSDFELHEKLGQGGMGNVFRATQKSLRKNVAVKILSASHLQAEESVQRFLREARSAAALRHPNIASVHGVGRCDQDGGYFIVMDLIEGKPLQAIENTLASKEVVKYGIQIADALHYAHQNGVVHRDVKPSNIIISDDKAILIDFGLSKLSHPNEMELSRTGDIMGSPKYMAPEQMDPSRGSANHQTDVFCLGGVLYFMQTGESPLTSDNFGQLAAELLSDDPIRISNHEQLNFSAELKSICEACLEKEPTDRPSSASEVADRLRAISTTEQAISPARASKLLSARYLFGLALLSVIVGAIFVIPKYFGSSVNYKLEPVVAQWQTLIHRDGREFELDRETRFRNGDRIRIKVNFSEPRYAYVYWLGSDGSMQWLENEGATSQPTADLHLPRQKNNWLPITGQPGVESCIVLVRDALLADPDNLIDKLKPTESLAYNKPTVFLDEQSELVEPSSDLIEGLDAPTRNIGAPEPLEDSSHSKWISNWPSDFGDFHYLLVPHEEN